MLVRPSMKRLFCPKAKYNLGRFAPSALRFSGASLILSCLTVSFSCGIVYSPVKRTPESEKTKTYVYIIKRKIKKKMLVYAPFVLALEGGVNSNPSSRARLFLRTINPRQLRTWLTRSVLPHTGDQARSVEYQRTDGRPSVSKPYFCLLYTSPSPRDRG